MAAPAANDANTRPAASEDVVALHILVSTILLGLGGALYALSLVSVVFPSIFPAALSFGRLRPAALSVTMIGWLVISFAGAAYYLLPRLTGAALWGQGLARIGMWVIAALSLAGAGISLAGMGDGGEPLGMPWWLDLALLVALLIPAVISVQTVRARTEPISYVSMWFVLTGVATLPVLQAAATVPTGSSLGRTLQGLNFTAGFTTLWVTGMGVGLAYYTVVKVTDQPLANRQLARAGFWSLAFAASWAGPLQMVYGPTPDWLDAVAAVLTLALPVAAGANTIVLANSIGPAWPAMRGHPSLRATMAGMGITVVVGLATSIAGFRSAAAMVGFTTYWEGVLLAALFGIGGLLVAGWTHQALPVVSGRQPTSTIRAIQHVRLTVWGVGFAAFCLMVGGIVNGLAWAGGAYVGNPPVGEAWAELTGAGSLMIGLSLVGVVVMIAGQLAFILSVFSTISSGRAGLQEVLVTTGDAES